MVAVLTEGWLEAERGGRGAGGGQELLAAFAQRAFA